MLHTVFLIASMPNDNFAVKFDFSDAFNCLHKADMLQSVAHRAPELLLHCHSAYAIPLILYYGQYTIEWLP